MLTPLEPIRCGSPILSRQEIKVKEFLKLFLALLAGFWNAFLHIGKGTALPFESVIVNTIPKQKSHPDWDDFFLFRYDEMIKYCAVFHTDYGLAFLRKSHGGCDSPQDCR